MLQNNGKVDHNISLQHETVSPKKSYYSEILNSSCFAVFQICLLHCAEKAHNNVHCRFDLIHLQLFVHDFLQPHFKSSWHALAASGRVVQYGVHNESLVSLCQPHIDGCGSSGLPISDCPQMYPA